MSLPIQTGHRRKGRRGVGKGILRPSWNAAVFLPERRTNSSLMRRNEHEHDQEAEGGRGELTYGPRLCRQLLRRPCTGRLPRHIEEERALNRSTLASVTSLSSLGHASSASRSVYSKIGNPAGSCLHRRLRPSERLIVLAQRHAKTPLLSLWQRDRERRSCIGR